MAAPINGAIGIERVSYQRVPKRERTDYPRTRSALPLAGATPTHIARVFRIGANAHSVEEAMRPKRADPRTTLPTRYAALFTQIAERTATLEPRTAAQRRRIEDAQSLLATMESEYKTLAAARNALIRA